MLVRVLVGIVFVSALGCSGDDITDPDDIVFPETNVSFAAHVQPLLNLSCNSTYCHGEPRAENKYIQLTSYLSVVSNIQVINQPRDTNCGLLNVVYGRIIHPGVDVNNNHRLGLRQWVLEGSQNN